MFFSKKQNTVEISTFGSEFIASRIAIELIESLRYKLRMFGVPLQGPTNLFMDNEAVYQNTSVPESTLKKKHLSCAYHRCREAVAAGTVRIAKEGTATNLAYLFAEFWASPRPDGRPRPHRASPGRPPGGRTIGRSVRAAARARSRCGKT